MIAHLETDDNKVTTKGVVVSYPPSEGSTSNVTEPVSVMDLIDKGFSLLGSPVIYKLKFNWYLRKED